MGTSIELGQNLNALLYASLIRQEYIDACEKEDVEVKVAPDSARGLTIAPNSSRAIFENINIGSINNSE